MFECLRAANWWSKAASTWRKLSSYQKVWAVVVGMGVALVLPHALLVGIIAVERGVDTVGALLTITHAIVKFLFLSAVALVITTYKYASSLRFE